MNSSFASLLDELIVDHAQAGTAEEAADAAAPAIHLDYLSVADQLCSGRIQVSEDAAAEEYREAGEDYASELEARLAEAAVLIETPPLGEDDLLPIEPEKIAAELGLGRADMTDFSRIRRTFAFANHPDRVAPHLRARAMQRMQVANGLIDDAMSNAGIFARS